MSTIDRLTSNRATPLLLLVAAAVAVYLNSLGNGFAFDDVAIIQENPRVHDLTDLRAIWLTPYWPYFGVELGLWRPLAIFGYALQWAAADGAAWPFHAVNVGLHALVTVLVFLLLERLTTRMAALAGALVFAVHPLHTEAVANIVGQAELIAAAAMVGACVLHVRRPEGVHIGWGRRLAILVLFLVGLLTKEHAVVLPALLLVLDLAQHRFQLTAHDVRGYLREVSVPLLLMVGVLAAYLLVRYSVLDGHLTGVEAGPQLHFLREEFRVLNALRAFPEFFRLFFFPQDLVADYSPAIVLPVESITLMTAIGALLLVATIVFALMTPWTPQLGLSAAWFLITVITVSNLFFPIGVLIAERTLYVPSVAVSFIVAYGWVAAADRLRPRARPFAVAALVLALLLGGVRTWVRNPDWQSTQTLLYSVLRDHPESYKAQWTHANWQWQLGKPDVARYHYELAYRIYPRDSQLLTEYANFLISSGDPQRALVLLEQAHAMHPYVPRTTLLLATTYLANGRFQDALRMADHATGIGLGESTTMPLRAAAWDGLGDEDRAVEAWRHMVAGTELQPPLQWAFVARRLAQAGHADDALSAAARGHRAAAAASDSAATRMMTLVEAAIRQGCFTRPADGASADAASAMRSSASTGSATAPDCDPLDGATPYVQGLQNATPLQNATVPAPSTPPPGGVQDGPSR